MVDPTGPLVDILLIGHDLRGDFPKMRAEGILFDPHLHYCGCIDTYVIVKDSRREQFGESLGRLVVYYGLAGGKIVKPRFLPASKAKLVFDGGHNAGNDAIATLKFAIAQAIDSEIKTKGYGKPEDDCDLVGVESTRYDRQRRPIRPAITEHGFACLFRADVADIPPGEKGTSWHPHIQARQWVNWEYRNFANYKYVVGNPLGFWKEFGETQYYHESEGAVPFHQLFQELANAFVIKDSSISVDDAAEGVATVEKVIIDMALSGTGWVKNTKKQPILCDSMALSKDSGTEDTRNGLSQAQIVKRDNI